MTRDVRTASVSTPLREVARVLVEHRISGQVESESDAGVLPPYPSNRRE
jgi:hypothetical protein